MPRFGHARERDKCDTSLFTLPSPLSFWPLSPLLPLPSREINASESPGTHISFWSPGARPVSSRHPSFQCSRRSRPRYRVVLLILIHLPPRCNTVKNQPKPSSRRGERSPSFLSPDLDTLALFLPVRSSRSRVLIVFIVLPGISNAVDASWTSPTPFSCTSCSSTRMHIPRTTAAVACFSRATDHRCSCSLFISADTYVFAWSSSTVSLLNSTPSEPPFAVGKL
uniref:Uncharacterized protein n=1 Tax=Oryza rufipogon TaxID=4529 RepID=A0A0E0QFP1_ORYRU